MTSLERALEICQKLEAAGVRATTDPAALNLPAVLVSLPSDRANDGMCSVTLTWQLDCIVPAPNGWDHTAWRQMDELVAAVEATFPIERSPGPWPSRDQGWAGSLLSLAIKQPLRRPYDHQ